jgi:hypothetical protein
MATEAEYKAIANATAELLWIRALLQELGVRISNPPTLCYDNIGATYMSVNPMFHACTKRVEIDFHFVRDRVADKSLVVRFVPCSNQHADVLTKPLVSVKFQQLCFKLNVRSPPLTLQEGIRTLAQDSKSQQESCAVQSVELSNRDSTKKSSTSIQKLSPIVES